MIANGAGISGQKGKQPCFEEKKKDFRRFLVYISAERQSAVRSGYFGIPS